MPIVIVTNTITIIVIIIATVTTAMVTTITATTGANLTDNSSLSFGGCCFCILFFKRLFSVLEGSDSYHYAVVIVFWSSAGARLSPTSGAG
ncbi:hypothetical protein AWA1501_00990 [Lactiplantibacillus pentosus]|nr:hypothetical protein AWA1501_00990 [Lactiplantibacillus pentosus]